MNPVVLSSTAKLVVDYGCFDHSCPIEFATQFELKEYDSSTRQLRTHQAQAPKHQSCRGLDERRDGAEIPLKIKFNVFDVKSPLLSTRKLRKHEYSVVLDQQQTIQKKGTTIVLTEQNGRAETREQTGKSRWADACAGRSNR